MRVALTLRRASVLLRSIVILCRRGLAHPLRPHRDLRALNVARRAGPFPAMILDSARGAPDSLALVDEAGTLTYGELEARANALAHGLAETGIGPGDVASILCRDHRGLVLSLIAAAKRGVR